ncbi:hypothetical protein NRI58_004856 [Vibrio parahaemolyticus]|nr:hypothetical protein [Vibrio parahaemolyticus]
MRIKQSDKPQEKESLTQGISSKTHPAYNAALRGAGTQYISFCKAP